MASYYKHIISGVRTEYYGFFDNGKSTVILEDDFYKLAVNNRTESEVQSFASSITEGEYMTEVDNLEDFARIGGHPPSKP